MATSNRSNIAVPKIEIPEWEGIVGKSFDITGFKKYCKSLKFDNWKPKFIVLHNTAIPSLAERPKGFSKQNIDNLEVFYRDVQKWSAGPHLFIDDKQIWVFTPLTVPGVHSPSWNKVSWGVEMLGDYETELFNKGRGAKVRNNTVAAISILNGIADIPANTLKLHHEDPKTTHKCPGQHVAKEDVIQFVEKYS
jgi:hypothetical protein